MFNELINGIANKAEQMVEINAKDYKKDGLIYCGNCDTPKQARFTIDGQEKIVYCLCKCESERRDREEKEFKERLKQEEYERKTKSIMRFYSNFKESTFENAEDSKITEIAKRYCTQFNTFRKDGKGLLFFGNVGTGKTYAAFCIVNELQKQGYDCTITNFPTLANRLQSGYDRQSIIDALTTYDLVVLDDLAAERNTEYMDEIVQNVIDTLYKAKKPIIVTTNLTSEELKNPYDLNKKRTYSRILEMCIPVKVEHKDRRRENAKENFKRYNEILGIK